MHTKPFSNGPKQPSFLSFYHLVLMAPHFINDETQHWARWGIGGKVSGATSITSKLANAEHGLSHSFAQCCIGQAPLVL